MSNLDKLTAEVVDVISDTLKLAKEKITNDTNIADLTADSIQLFELLIAFEKHYGSALAYDEVVRLNTVGDIINYAAKLQSVPA
ncbi:MAG: phosphopantetheine-binding protein [Candidatus Paceibacterota bacterium]